MLVFPLFFSLIFQFPSENPCGQYRNEKRGDALFQDVRVLTLHCDQTFTFKQSNCIHPNSSSGTWTINGNTITLTSSKKVVKLALKGKKSETGFLYVDMTGQSLFLQNSRIIWDRSAARTDTLYKK